MLCWPNSDPSYPKVEAEIEKDNISKFFFYLFFIKIVLVLVAFIWEWSNRKVGNEGGKGGKEFRFFLESRLLRLPNNIGGSAMVAQE